VKPFTRSGDFWSGLALAALGTYIVGQARTWPYMTDEGPGPGFFPLWYGSLMIVLSLALVAAAVMKRAPVSNAVNWPEVRRALTCWVAFVASIAIMPWAGFVVSFALLTWFIVAVMAKQPQRIALPLAIGGAVLFYAIFDFGLDLTLPHGVFF
jgi:putative tricarboxylic transport membrane protein